MPYWYHCLGLVESLLYFILLGDSHWSFFSTWCWHLLKNLHLSRKILRFSNIHILQATGYFTVYEPGTEKKRDNLEALFKGFYISSVNLVNEIIIVTNPKPRNATFCSFINIAMIIFLGPHLILVSEVKDQILPVESQNVWKLSSFCVLFVICSWR